MAWFDDYNNRADVAMPTIAPPKAQSVKQAPAKPSPKSRNNWLKFLPTAAGVGGTLAAAPFTGGASLLGTAAILGGAGLAGGALGEFGAEKIHHEKVNLGSIAKEGAVSGALSAIPLGGFARAARVANPGRAILPKTGLKLPEGINLDFLSKGGKIPVNHTSFADLKKNPKFSADDAKIQQILSGRGGAGGTIEKNQANLTDTDRLALTGGDAGQAGLSTGAKFNPATGKIEAGTGAPGVIGQHLKTSIPGRLDTFADKKLAGQYGTISKPIARATQPLQTVRELAEAGLTKPEDVERVARAVTGGEGLVTKAVSDAVGNAKGVDVSNLRRTFTDALDNLGIVDKDRKSLTTMFDAQMNKLSGGAAGSINPKVNPTDALETMKAFEKRIAALRGKGETYSLPTPERLDQAKALGLVRDELEERLYTGAGADAGLSKILTPEFGNSLKALHGGNKQWAKYVDEKVLGAKTVKELRHSMAPFVRASKIIDEGETNAMTAGGRLGNQNANPTIRGAVLSMVNSNPARRAAAAIARRESDLVEGAGGGIIGKARPIMGEGFKQGMGGILSGNIVPEDASALASADATGGGGADPSNPYGSEEALQAAAQRYAADPTSQEFIGVDPSIFGYPPDNTTTPTPGTDPMQQAAQGGAEDGGMNSLVDNADQINKALSVAAIQALQSGDTAGLDNIMKTAQLIQSMQQMQLDQQKATATGNNTTKITGQQAGLAQNGVEALQQLKDLIQSNPNVVSHTAIPGRGLPGIGGYIAHNAGTTNYDAIGYNIADNYLRLKTGAQANASEIKDVQSKLMPRAGDDADQISNKLNLINNYFNTILGMADQSGTGSDTSDLMQQLQQLQSQGAQ